MNMEAQNNIIEDDAVLPELPTDFLEADEDLLNLIIDIIQREMPPPTEGPFVVITEQPQSKALRFRYECEGRSAGSIPGVHSTQEQKTFPSIEVKGYKGRAVVVVSCVTKDPPYKPHPHNLVGKDGCKKGVCTVEINSNTMTYTFSNLGIQCVKKKDIEEALRLREEIRVDPFKTGYDHARQPATIDLNAVRLCFQVFLEGSTRGRFTEQLLPVVSDVIYDKKAMSDLVICKLSDVTASVEGGKEIILLCEKVAKEDISVRFYEEQHGNIVWQAEGEFQHTNVHKQVAICFRTPRYNNLDVDHSVKAHIQLRRPSDGATSEPLPFELLPLHSDNLRRKRQKINSWDVRDHAIAEGSRVNYYGLSMLNVPGDAIKREPGDSPTHPFPGVQTTYRNPSDTPSPVERSPIAIHGSTTPVGPTSPYGQALNNLGQTTGTYQPQPNNDFYGNQNFTANYNFPAPATINQPMYQPEQRPQQQLQSTPNQFQLPNANNTNGANTYIDLPYYGGSGTNFPATLSLQQPGPSGLGAQPTGQVQQQQQQQQHQTASVNAPIDCNLSSLLDMDLGSSLALNSTELKLIINQSYNSDVKQEQLPNNNNNNLTMITHQHRMQQDEENLSNSFTKLTTLNDLDK